MRASYLLAGLASAALASSVASAATINLDTSFNAAAGSSAFYIVNNDFTLPTGFSNAVLTITGLSIDDRGVVLLNDVIVDNGGIFGPGNGNLVLTLGGPNNPFTYTRGNGARNVVVTSGFQAGLNSFRIVVNDTNNGIFGDVLPGGVNISAGSLTASITFNVGNAVPEPASWAMMLAGFALAGAAARRRVTVRHA
ncbi:PEPxxWA-CTERM sorting domain-containing protein [Sphingomonas sp.]|jgi:hypothetical protein|uniref:PEPxxWA-CTERM sorting domain-containing protein n=1 Tax=Sphingomonas sp. TaxID=28214 RepID=UPI002DF515C2|nr:PEPxxWA-CTERM sorting domain-containing protein [Sphingomonas sp.]